MSDVEKKLMDTETQIKQLLSQKSNYDHESGLSKDKEISIRQIVEDERNIIESRFQRDLSALREKAD